MHELSITRNIVATVQEHARGRTVTGVTLRVGTLSGIEVDAVRFCFDVCAEGTALQGATLTIERVQACADCTECGKRVELQRLVAICPCEKRARLDLVAGDELLIQSMEVR